MTEPSRPPYRHEKEEKADEKQRGNEEKNRGEKSTEEKWRRDAVSAVAWSGILIWAGLMLLAETTNWGYRMFYWWNTWAMIFTGAGVILLLSVLFRLVMPEHRRPIIGNLVFGVILMSIGLGSLTTFGWGFVAAIALIVIGLSIVLGGVFRKRR